jgi:hypothetical protein
MRPRIYIDIADCFLSNYQDYEDKISLHLSNPNPTAIDYINRKLDDATSPDIIIFSFLNNPHSNPDHFSKTISGIDINNNSTMHYSAKLIKHIPNLGGNFAIIFIGKNGKPCIINTKSMETDFIGKTIDIISSNDKILTKLNRTSLTLRRLEPANSLSLDKQLRVITAIRTHLNKNSQHATTLAIDIDGTLLNNKKTSLSQTTQLNHTVIKLLTWLYRDTKELFNIQQRLNFCLYTARLHHDISIGGELYATYSQDNPAADYQIIKALKCALGDQSLPFLGTIYSAQYEHELLKGDFLQQIPRLVLSNREGLYSYTYKKILKQVYSQLYNRQRQFILIDDSIIQGKNFVQLNKFNGAQFKCAIMHAESDFSTLKAEQKPQACKPVPLKRHTNPTTFFNTAAVMQPRRNPNLKTKIKRTTTATTY